MEEVVERVAERVLPPEEERERNEDMFVEIRSFIRDRFDRDSRLMGSIAKDTFMSGDRDLDIFVFFDPGTDDDALEEGGLAIGEAVFEEFDGDYVVEYAEHPYTKGTIDGFEVEIIPAYDVASGSRIRSSVDRTPFHTDWVNEHLSSEEKRDVVLLKAFLRGQGLYGSTLKIEGFSGYLCELLIAEYGSFAAVLEAATDWGEREVLDPADNHEQLPNYLQEKFEDDALIVIDPVDPERNVAAVLDTENYARFVYRAWRFLNDPREIFFFPEEPEVDREAVADAVEDRGAFVQITFPAPDLLDDLLYPQMRSLMDRLRYVVRDNEFGIVEDGFHAGDDEVRILFEVYTDTLPATRKQEGPKVFHNTTHLKNFTEKYEDVWVEGKRLVAMVEREHRTVQGLLEDFLSGDLHGKGVPKNLVDAVQERTIGDVTLEGEDWLRFLHERFRLG